MTKSKLLTTFSFWAAIGILAALNQACSTVGKRPDRPWPGKPTGNTITLPPNTQAVLFLQQDGTLRVTDVRGEPFKVCLLCSAAYVQEHPDDPGCDKLRKRIAELPKKVRFCTANSCDPTCCSKEYQRANPHDPNCNELWKRIAELSKMGDQPNICRGLIKATMNSIIPVTVIKSHTNPDCAFIASFGTEVGTMGSAAYEALRQWLEAYGWLLGWSPEQIATILASPLESCLH